MYINIYNPFTVCPHWLRNEWYQAAMTWIRAYYIGHWLLNQQNYISIQSFQKMLF